MGLIPHLSLTFPNYQAAEGCSSAFGSLGLWPFFSSFAFLLVPLLNLTTKSASAAYMDVELNGVSAEMHLDCCV